MALSQQIELFDTHAHLDAEEFAEDLDQVIERAATAGVSRIVSIAAGEGFRSAERVRELCEGYSQIWSSVGIHPHDASTPLDYDRLKLLAQHSKVVAIGETGLDFFKEWSPRKDQEEWFRAHIDLAISLKKPLIVHSRDAAAECYSILKELNAEQTGGVFHCYSEDSDFAQKLADINFIVSFPGTITFKKAVALQNAAKLIPLEQIMLETDAPYLAPVPYRGKRCESAFILETARALAELRGISLAQVAEQTTANALKFFKLKAEN